jgi:hypothetical protein
VPDVLIRDVPVDDLELMRSAARERGTSLQNYLREAMRAQAAHLRRQAALARTAERLGDRPPVPEEERQAAFGAIDDAHADRADHLSDPSAR